MARKRANPNKIINERSEIYGSCNCRTKFHKLSRLDKTLRTHLMQKKSPHSSKSTQTRPTRPTSSVITSSCKYCHTQPQSTKDKFPFNFDIMSTPNSQCCQFCDKPEKTIIEKLHPTNHKQIGGFSFNTETQLIRPIQLTWKQHRIDKVKVPYPSQWQYLKSNPSKLVFVGDPKIQLGLVDRNIPGIETRDPTNTPSNLEISQIIEASSIYPKVAETFAYINLVYPNPVGKIIWTATL